MAKILISWLAVENDFIKENETFSKPNPNGPTSNVYRNFYAKYDYHLILSSSEKPMNGDKLEILVSFLKESYKYDIRPVYLGIKDIIDLKEIKVKVSKLLLEHRKDEIEIFISPGTPTMQVAWYFLHLELAIKTKLFQIRPAKHSEKSISEKIYVDLEHSNIPSGLIIRETINDSSTYNYKVTKSIQDTYDLAYKVASSDNTSVLILGETGTGKELLAKYIQRNSARAENKFLAINCASLGDQLLESRLFGYVKGAFTGAIETTNGYFQNADKGTIFLDEIGDITPYMQKVLLRVLQEKEICKIGSTKTEKIDVRIISATNKNLYEMCLKGEFRLDLYYRLSVVELKLPSLVERGFKEIEEIFDFLVAKHEEEFNKLRPTFSKELKKILFSHSFPGNIRELENIVSRIFALSDGEAKIEHLPNYLKTDEYSKSLKLIDVENQHIQKVLKMCEYNKKKASEILGIKWNTLDSRIKKYQLM